VIIEHRVRPDWKLADGTKPVETTASLYRFRVKVEPKAGAQLMVEEYHPLDARVELSDISDHEVTVLTDQKRMTPELQQAIKRVLDQKSVIDGLDAQLQVRHQEVNSITSDQGRIRENMKALKGSVEEKALLQRYTHQLDQQEDRLGVLRAQISDLTTQRQQASDQLDKIIAEISLDERF
jgi:chromosome segregation ATPase